MSVKIRLSRVGKKHSPIYRIIVTDSRNQRDCKYIEYIGTYNPLLNKFDKFHQDRVEYWVSKGAQPTDAVKKLFKQYKKLPKTVTPAQSEVSEVSA